MVFGGYGDDVVHRQVAQHARLDLDFLCVSFPFHFIARLQLLAGHHAGGFEHGDARGLQVVVENERAARFAVQTPMGGLRLPFVRVAVAVKTDRLALLDVAADNFNDGGDFRFTLFDERVHVLLEPGKLFGNGRVERNHGTGTVCLRAYGAEFEAIAGEGERRGAVAVGIVNQQFGNLRDVQLHSLFACQ